MYLPWHGSLAAVVEGRIYIPSGGVKREDGATRASLMPLRLERRLSLICVVC